MRAARGGEVIRIATREGDDAGFIHFAERLLRGVAARDCPPRFVVLRTDNWFDAKWLGYPSSREFAMDGAHVSRLLLPPFVSNRVPEQTAFEWFDADRLYRAAEVAPVYPPWRKGPRYTARQTPPKARYAHRVAPGTALAWIAGNSAANGRGAIMVYTPLDASIFGWYCGMVLRRSTWCRERVVGIEPAMLDRIEAAGESALA